MPKTDRRELLYLEPLSRFILDVLATYGYTQRQFCREFHIPSSSLNDLINLRHDPCTQTMILLAEGLTKLQQKHSLSAEAISPLYLYELIFDQSMADNSATWRTDKNMAPADIAALIRLEMAGKGKSSTIDTDLDEFAFLAPYKTEGKREHLKAIVRGEAIPTVKELGPIALALRRYTGKNYTYEQLVRLHGANGSEIESEN